MERGDVIAEKSGSNANSFFLPLAVGRRGEWQVRKGFRWNSGDLRCCGGIACLMIFSPCFLLFCGGRRCGEGWGRNDLGRKISGRGGSMSMYAAGGEQSEGKQGERENFHSERLSERGARRRGTEKERGLRSAQTGTNSARTWGRRIPGSCGDRLWRKGVEEARCGTWTRMTVSSLRMQPTVSRAKKGGGRRVFSLPMPSDRLCARKV